MNTNMRWVSIYTVRKHSITNCRTASSTYGQKTHVILIKSSQYSRQPTHCSRSLIHLSGRHQRKTRPPCVRAFGSAANEVKKKTVISILLNYFSLMYFILFNRLYACLFSSYSRCFNRCRTYGPVALLRS